MKFFFGYICVFCIALVITPSWAQGGEIEGRHKGKGGGGGGGGYKGKGGGGGGGGYKPEKCHPQTITKYKTIVKDRKANVFNQVEVLKPIPHVKKIKETRYTTIRYPVFITQVIKPMLTQVETKVKPVFFTKTINKYTTVLFTVTGIGQVTVTSVKYEKEYITRCMKKGGHKKGGYHRREYENEGGPMVREYERESGPMVREYQRERGPMVREYERERRPMVSKHDVALPLETEYPSEPTRISAPPGIPYDRHYGYPEQVREVIIEDRPYLEPGPSPRVPNQRYNSPNDRYPPRRHSGPRRPSKRRGPPESPIAHLMRPFRRNVNRSGSVEVFDGVIGDVKDLYSGDLYYLDDTVSRSGRAELFLEASSMPQETLSTVVHPKLENQPIVIIT